MRLLNANNLLKCCLLISGYFQSHPLAHRVSSTTYSDKGNNNIDINRLPYSNVRVAKVEVCR